MVIIRFSNFPVYVLANLNHACFPSSYWQEYQMTTDLRVRQRFIQSYFLCYYIKEFFFICLFESISSGNPTMKRQKAINPSTGFILIQDFFCQTTAMIRKTISHIVSFGCSIFETARLWTHVRWVRRLLSPWNPLFKPAARCEWFLSRRTFEMPPVSRLRQFKVWHANDIYAQLLSAGDGNQLLVMPTDCLNTWADWALLHLKPSLAHMGKKMFIVVSLSADTQYKIMLKLPAAVWKEGDWTL